VTAFTGNWNCAADDQFQEDGWPSHFASWSTWYWKGSVSSLSLHTLIIDIVGWVSAFIWRYCYVVWTC